MISLKFVKTPNSPHWFGVFSERVNFIFTCFLSGKGYPPPPGSRGGFGSYFNFMSM